MKKQMIVVFAALIAIFAISGCGRWCSLNNDYCVGGFTGFTRYPSTYLGSEFFYTHSVLVVTNNVQACVVDVYMDGILIMKGLPSGMPRRFDIPNLPNEDKQVALTAEKFCGKKFKGTYSAVMSASSRRPVSFPWVLN